MKKATKLIQSSIIASSVFVFSGCASVMEGSSQQIHINAYDSKTNENVAANCMVSNDEGVYRTASNRSSIVKKDKDLLRIECQNDTHEGQAMIDGSIQWGYWALDFFIIDLCIISCWIDGFSGSWAEYPVMIDVPMDPKPGMSIPPSSSSTPPTSM